MADDNRFGFIVMDGNGSLFGTLCGNTRNVLQKFTVDLPKKHGTAYIMFSPTDDSSRTKQLLYNTKIATNLVFKNFTL